MQLGHILDMLEKLEKKIICTIWKSVRIQFC